MQLVLTIVQLKNCSLGIKLVNWSLNQVSNIINSFLQVRLVCIAEKEPKHLFQSSAISQIDDEANRLLMDDLGIQEVNLLNI